MSNAHKHSFSNFLFFGLAAIAIFAVCAPVAGHAASDKPPYLTAPAATVQTEIGLSRKIGEFDGDTYYFKPAGGPTGQIFRVSKADPTKFAMVGLILNNKLMIQTSEKSGFFALVTDQPPSAFTLDTSVAPAPPVVGAPVRRLLPPMPQKDRPLERRRGATGTYLSFTSTTIHIFTMTLLFGEKGHIEISRDGSKFADLGYTGGGYGEGAGTKGFKMTMNEIERARMTFERNESSGTWWFVKCVSGDRVREWSTRRAERRMCW